MTQILTGKCRQFGQQILRKSLPVFSAPKFIQNLKPNTDFYKTSQTDPKNHTEEDIGLYYHIPNKLSLDVLYNLAFFDADFIEECKTFKETPILIRKPAVEIIKYLNTANYDYPINKYVLYGKHGSGKSITMAHLIHYAYTSGWLIVHTPRARSWLYTKKEYVESSVEKGCIDIPHFGTTWLMHFKNQNQELIRKLELKLQNTYKWTSQEISSEGESLMSLVEYGILRANFSCAVIGALMKEVKELSKNRKVKTLVVLDEFSLIFTNNTRHKTPESQLYKPTDISAIRAFKSMLNADWHNGAAVMSCESPEKSKGVEYLPLELLTRDGFEFLDPFVPVEVPPLTDLEMTSILEYFRHKNWLGTSLGDLELKFLCAGNPLTLRKLCAPL